MGTYLSIKSSEDSESDDESNLPPQSNNMSSVEHTKLQQNLGNLCVDSATDAFDASTFSSKPIGITLEQVLQTEKQLDLYEKVSLVYLLLDDPNRALDECSKLLNFSRDKVLYNWAMHQNVLKQKWQEKFIEAIAIIQNYQILANLAFVRSDLEVRFLPQHSFTAACINKVRKGLYRLICEDFSINEITPFLREVHVDFEARNLNFQMFDCDYLEMFLLHWESVGYFNQNNLGSLCGVLKRMELFNLSDNLKLVVPTHNENIQTNKPVKKNTDDSRKPPDIYTGILSSASLADFVSMNSQIDADSALHFNSENEYRIDPQNPGVCLIINQESFYKEIDPQYKNLLVPPVISFDERFGTQKDKEELETTFKGFGFKTEIANNLTHAELLKKIESTIFNITNESSLFICILSHGDKGVVYGVNSCKVEVEKIQQLLCTKNRINLLGKPKVLILQSCQGQLYQKITPFDEEDDITTDGPCERVPPRADLFTFWATVPGFSAIRNKKTGTWFIQSLCRKMKDLGNKHHFEEICTMVNLDVSSRKWIHNKDEISMVPLKETTLRKLLYLPPILEQQSQM